MSTNEQPPPQEQPARDEGFERLRREQRDPKRVAARESAQKRPS